MLVDTKAQGAKNKEKTFATQAKVNGVQDLWADFQGGYTPSFEQSFTPTGQTSSGIGYSITQQ
jgi:hypothetical protein